MPRYCDYIDLPLSPEQERRLNQKREKLSRITRRIKHTFGDVLTEWELGMLGRALLKHDNARRCLFDDRNFRSATAFLREDRLDVAAEAVERLARAMSRHTAEA